MEILDKRVVVTKCRLFTNVWLLHCCHYVIYVVFSGPNQQQGKKIHLDKGGNINIFIAIDASDSIDKDHIQKSIDITKNLIEKVCWSGHLFSSTYTEHESRTYISFNMKQSERFLWVTVLVRKSVSAVGYVFHVTKARDVNLYTECERNKDVWDVFGVWTNYWIFHVRSQNNGGKLNLCVCIQCI